MKKQPEIRFETTTELIKFLESLQKTQQYGFMSEVLRHLRIQAKAIRLLKKELKGPR